MTRQYRFFFLCGFIAAFCSCEHLASAQTRNQNQSGFGSTGTSSGFGSTGFGSTGGTGGSGFGSTGSGFGSTSGIGGTSGFGTQNGLGGQLGGQNQFGQNSNGILGRNTNTNQFLGRNMQTQGANSLQNQMGGNRGGRGGGGGNRGQNQMNNGGSGNNNQAPLVRPRLKVAFDHPQPVPSEVREKFIARMDKLSKRSPSLSHVSVSIDDVGEVTLKGQVASESDAKLAENLIRIEPGIRSVKNELSFKPTDPANDE